jgi:hypothetical protein
VNPAPSVQTATPYAPDAPPSAHTTGVINFTPQVHRLVGERCFTASHHGGACGHLSFAGDHDWAWGWGTLLRALGAKVGDVLRATLDLTDGTAWVEVGGRDLFGAR